MVHPLFDAKPLSDDELVKKLSVLMSRLNYARGFIGDQDMIDQLEAMIETIQIERDERFAKQSWDAWQSQFPEVNNTDPDFKVEKKADERKSQRPEGKFKRPMAPMIFQVEENPAAKANGKTPNNGKTK